MRVRRENVLWRIRAVLYISTMDGGLLHGDIVLQHDGKDAVLGICAIVCGLFLLWSKYGNGCHTLVGVGDTICDIGDCSGDSRLLSCMSVGMLYSRLQSNDTRSILRHKNVVDGASGGFLRQNNMFFCDFAVSNGYNLID